jgi:predicted dehydrogenase
MKTNQNTSNDFNRRDFLKGGSMATLMTMLGGIELTFQPEAKAVDASTLHGPTVNLGVIGLGGWGREILTTLSRIPEANVAAICDKYPAFLRRAAKFAEKAEQVEDYKKILDNKEIKAVFIATPTHQHREIAVAALQAGKHVYCEAPLAHTLEDARAIALAAKNAPKVVFQAGLQLRSDKQRHFVLGFVRSGATGKTVMNRAQWFKRQSWRQTSPNPEREKELNWRLSKETSLGLVGEIGIHQVDFASWFNNVLPVSVSGFGSIRCWDDGRDVADTEQVNFEYPDGLLSTWNGTLANSFEGEYEVVYGSESAILLRGSKAWMFKESDARLLGWEVYAKKEVIGEETGIVLRMNASKSTEQAGQPGQDKAPVTQTSLELAMANFLTNVNEVGAGVEDFAASFNINDKAALVKFLSEIKRQPAAGYKEGYEATVTVIKANEAVLKGQKVALSKELFELA